VGAKAALYFEQPDIEGHNFLIRPLGSKNCLQSVLRRREIGP